MRLAVACLAVCAFTQSVAAEVVFRGSVDSVRAQNCRSQGSGWDFNSVFHPKITGNSGFNAISLVHQYGGMAYETTKSLSKTAFVPVSAHGLGWGYWSFDTAKVKILSSTPASLGSISDTTRFVFLKFQIQGPDEDPGVDGRPCVVTYEGSYRRD